MLLEGRDGMQAAVHKEAVSEKLSTWGTGWGVQLGPFRTPPRPSFGRLCCLPSENALPWAFVVFCGLIFPSLGACPCSSILSHKLLGCLRYSFSSPVLYSHLLIGVLIHAHVFSHHLYFPLEISGLFTYCSVMDYTKM